MLGGTLLFALASLSLVRDTYEELRGPAITSRQDDLLRNLSTRLDIMAERGRNLTFNQAAEYLVAANAGRADPDHPFLMRVDEANTQQGGFDAAVVIGRGGDILHATVPGGYSSDPPGVDEQLVREFAKVFAGDQPWEGIIVRGPRSGLLSLTPVRPPTEPTIVGYLALYDAFDADLQLPDLRDGLDGVTFVPRSPTTSFISAPFLVERDGTTGTMSFRSDVVRLVSFEVTTAPPAELATLEARTMRDLTIRVVIFGVLIGVVLLVWFERRLLSRMSTLTELVSSATDAPESRPTVELSGADELSALANRIEETLTSLEEARDDLAEANEALLAADHAKNSFISVVSHELRTPLTSILGFTETLRTHWAALDPERARDFLGRMSGQARALDRMVEDLLVLSRMQSGKVRYEPETVRLPEFLGETLRALPGGDGVALRSVEDVNVTADPDHLRRMLTNYVENAFKYGEPPVEVRTDRSGDLLILRVLDGGAGVPDEFVPQLFERFTQASSGDTRESSGVGLGLSIVRQLAEHNGGTAWYERFEGRSCFAVSVPVASLPVPTDDLRRLSPA